MEKAQNRSTDPFWMQRLGGAARMKKLTKKQRSDFGKMAIAKRWAVRGKKKAA